MTVKLTKPGFDDVTSTNVYVDSRVRAECLFDLTGKSDGIWNMTLTRADGKTTTLLNAITLVRPLIPIQGMNVTPTDLNSDGKYEDLNGNGQLDYADVNLFAHVIANNWIVDNEPVLAFDFTGIGGLSYEDVLNLFDMIS